MTDRIRRWLLLLGLPVVVHGAWGYDALDLVQYTAGCLLGLVTIGLFVAVRLRG